MEIAESRHIKHKLYPVTKRTAGVEGLPPFTGLCEIEMLPFGTWLIKRSSFKSTYFQMTIIHLIGSFTIYFITLLTLGTNNKMSVICT